MKVCLFLEGQEIIGTSGFRSAFEHHRKALELVGVELTSDPRDDYDLLHTHWFGPKSLFAVKRARKRGIPTVCHAHSMGSHDFRDSFTFSNLLSPLYERYLIHYYNRADAVFTCSLFAKRVLEGIGIKVPIHVVSNGSDAQRLNYDEEGRRRYREKLGLRRFTFFGSGNIIPRKGVVDFLDVAEMMPDYDFVWFGKQWKRALAFSSAMHKRLKEAPPNVHLPGFVSDIAAAYSSCDCLFFTPYTENQPMVILESAALGLPLVLRSIPEYEGFLTDSENCLLAENNEQFVEQLTRVATDPELRQKLRDGARALSFEHDLPRVGEHLKRLYDELLEKRHMLNPVQKSESMPKQG